MMGVKAIVLTLTLAAVVPGPVPASQAADSGSAAESQMGSRRPQWTLISANPRKGLSGSIRQGASQLNFSSRVEKGVLTSSLTDSQGKVLWLYQEGVAWRQLGGEVRMMIGDQPFDGTYSDAVRETIEEIARSGAGTLLPELALKLHEKAQGTRLTAERRGLQTAFQAMQGGYPPFFHAAETPDYVVSPGGGFVVKTQHTDAVFANNFMASRAGDHDHEAAEKDDSHIDNDCFGMCGSGCTSEFGCGFQGWTHDWVGTPSITVTQSCDCTLRDSATGAWCGDPLYVQFTYRSGTAVHTIHGRSANGCIAHDTCCRTIPYGCYLSLLCHTIGVEALVECANGGWPYTASYVGPQSDRLTAYLPVPPSCTCQPCPSGSGRE